MTALPPGISAWSPIASMSRWWQNRVETNAAVSEPKAPKDSDFGSLPKPTGISAAKDFTMTDPGPESINLLLRRMFVLDLDRNEVARTDPQIFQELQATCVKCESRRQCAFDLAHYPDNDSWQDYCPNVAKLKMLNVLKWNPCWDHLKPVRD